MKWNIILILQSALIKLSWFIYFLIGLENEEKLFSLKIIPEKKKWISDNLYKIKKIFIAIKRVFNRVSIKKLYTDFHKNQNFF